MSPVKIRSTSLLNLTELEFIPEPPKVLSLSDEIALSLSLLTAATGHDRKILRCNQQGALLVGNAWDNMAVVANDELFINSGTPDSTGALAENKGVLIASTTAGIQLTIVRVSGGASEIIYIPGNYLYFFPHGVYSVSADAVPITGSGSTYVGITTFK